MDEQNIKQQHKYYHTDSNSVGTSSSSSRCSTTNTRYSNDEAEGTSSAHRSYQNNSNSNLFTTETPLSQNRYQHNYHQSAAPAAGGGDVPSPPTEATSTEILHETNTTGYAATMSLSERHLLYNELIATLVAANRETAQQQRHAAVVNPYPYNIHNNNTAAAAPEEQHPGGQQLSLGLSPSLSPTTTTTNTDGSYSNFGNSPAAGGSFLQLPSTAGLSFLTAGGENTAPTTTPLRNDLQTTAFANMLSQVFNLQQQQQQPSPLSLLTLSLMAPPARAAHEQQSQRMLGSAAAVPPLLLNMISQSPELLTGGTTTTASTANIQEYITNLASTVLDHCSPPAPTAAIENSTPVSGPHMLGAPLLSTNTMSKSIAVPHQINNNQRKTTPRYEFPGHDNTQEEEAKDSASSQETSSDASSAGSSGGVTGGPPRNVSQVAMGPMAVSIPIFLEEQDAFELSPYQCLVRKQIELFEQPKCQFQEEITIQGRNRPVIAGQVGIRCRHCGHTKNPSRGAVFFPSTLVGVYQAAQNMANSHLIKVCKLIPEDTRKELLEKRSREKGQKTCKSAYGGGRQYWANALKVLKVVESEDRRLQFSTYSMPDPVRSITTNVHTKSPFVSRRGGNSQNSG